MAQDPYYRQMLEWSKQQAAQQAQRQQEQVNIQRINEERERLRREHLERTRIYEAQTLATAASAAAGAGGGGNRTPAVDNSSTGTVTFNGIDQYIEAPNAQVVTWLPGTASFTIEWFMKKGDGGSSFPRVFSLGFDQGATIGCSIEGGTCYIWPYGGSLSGSMPTGYNDGSSWIHIAISRSGTNTRLFINGSLKMTKTSDTRNINDSINPGFNLNMGVDDPTAGAGANWWSGQLTNFRWDNSAVYTGTFSVPTSPLTQLADTKLLMLGGNQTNPVVDSTGVNTLQNYGSTWSPNTPFV